MNNSNTYHARGRFFNDPELQTVEKDGKTFKFTKPFDLAVSRNYKNKEGKYDYDAPTFRASGKTAEMICQYFHKGDTIDVSGPMVTDVYTDKEGKKRKAVYIQVENIDFHSSIIKRGDKAAADNADATPAAEPVQEEIGQVIDDDDDLPF